MVTEIVVNKLTTISLTVENIKKLEYLAAVPPLGQLTTISLMEENVKKLTFLKGGTPLAFDGCLQVVWPPL